MRGVFVLVVVLAWFHPAECREVQVTHVRELTSSRQPTMHAAVDAAVAVYIAPLARR